MASSAHARARMARPAPVGHVRRLRDWYVLERPDAPELLVSTDATLEDLSAEAARYYGRVVKLAWTLGGIEVRT